VVEGTGAAVVVSPTGSVVVIRFVGSPSGRSLNPEEVSSAPAAASSSLTFM
jgi:hypothetical protein